MPESPSRDQPKRQSVLHHFAAIPQRALGDRRLKTNHFRVLATVCRAIDPETGFSLISQKSIARWANTPRQKVGGPLNDLHDWGYIEKIPQGRRQSGQYLTLLYRVFYDSPAADHDTRADDSGRVTPAGDKPESLPGVSDSDLLNANLQKRPERAFSGLHDNAAAKQLTRTASRGTKASSALPSPNGASVLPDTRPFDSAKELSRRHLQELAEQKGISWENELMKQAERRIFSALQKAFPDEAFAPALEAFGKADYDRAVELELRQHWEGAHYLIQKVKMTVRP